MFPVLIMVIVMFYVKSDTEIYRLISTKVITDITMSLIRPLELPLLPLLRSVRIRPF